MKLQQLITCNIIFLGLAVFSLSLYAEAPDSDLGAVKNNIELRGAVINAGASIGGFKGGGLEMETSIGTIHGSSSVGGDVNNDILIYGLLGGISVVNAAVTWQGNLCSKVAIGSLGASTCTYGSNSNIGHSLKETQ